MTETHSTILRYPLEKRKIMKKTIAAYLGFGILFLAVFLPANIFLWGTYSNALVAVDGIFVLIFAIEPFYQYLYYKKYFYDVRSDFLVIRKGVIMIRETILDYDKLQDVYVDQDLLDRIFGLWDVHVSTATAMSGAAAHIDGVNHSNATAIRDIILSKIRSAKKR